MVCFECNVQSFLQISELPDQIVKMKKVVWITTLQHSVDHRLEGESMVKIPLVAFGCICFLFSYVLKNNYWKKLVMSNHSSLIIIQSIIIKSLFNLFYLLFYLNLSIYLLISSQSYWIVKYNKNKLTYIHTDDKSIGTLLIRRPPHWFVGSFSWSLRKNSRKTLQNCQHVIVI